MNGWQKTPVPISSAKVVGRKNPWEMLAVEHYSDASDWEFIMNSGSASVAWTISNNTIVSPTGQSNDSYAFFKPAKLDDGRIQVIYENPDTALTSWCGLGLRANTNTDLIAVLIFNNGTLGVYKFVSNTYTPIQSGTLGVADVALSTGVPVVLEVEIVGSTLKVFINSRLSLTCTDAALSDYHYGKCGLVADMGRAYKFSNFSIRRRRFDMIPASISTALCIGSSITYGIGQNTVPWPTLLQTLLNQRFAAKPVKMVNGGVSGNTTADMLGRLPALITDNTPDVVLIECSVNDCKDTTFISFDATLSNLRKMIKLCKQAGAVPLITTATPIGPGINYPADGWSQNSWRRLYPLNARVRQLAAEEGIILIDNANAFDNNLDLLNGDQIHPNDAGAQVMADTALKAVLGA